MIAPRIRTAFWSIQLFLLLGAPSTFANSALESCRDLLGSYRHMLSNDAVNISWNHPVLFSEPDFSAYEKKSTLLLRTGFPELAHATENLNHNIHDPEAHAALLVALRPRLLSRGLNIMEPVWDASDPIPTLLARVRASRTRIDIDRSEGADHFHGFVDDAEGWNTRIMLDTSAFIDRNSTRAWVQRRHLHLLELAPPFIQWTQRTLSPSTIHELVHLAFAFQRSADLAGEIPLNALPPIFLVTVPKKNILKASRELGVYATERSPSHSTDEADAHLATSLVHLAIAEKSVEQLSQLSRLDLLGAHMHAKEAISALETARGILDHDHRVFKKALKELETFRGGTLVKTEDKVLDRRYITKSGIVLSFSRAQASSRFNFPTFAGDTRHDSELARAMQKLLALQIAHYDLLLAKMKRLLRPAGVYLFDINQRMSELP